ncbi:MAG: anthranilate phosphoribosyltransferase [Verrucomicrobia bacterium]|nr:anthranilate phosphoribosyltransferase [Verrucomicrobiota bacterium]
MFHSSRTLVVLALLTQLLDRGQSLSDKQVATAVAAIIDEQVPALAKADFLAALARKGETPAEIAGFARGLRDLSIQPPLDAETRGRQILDVCGTGGDRLNTFNISTCVALIAAAGGITVAKHGNRAVTSQAGSADVLEALGVAIDLTPVQAARALRERRFAFFFAPRYHPTFKHIAAARKLCAERGQRTIFNFLGPLLNPARPTAQLIGVPHPRLCEPIAKVLQTLGVRRGMVVSGRVGEAYLDELSTLGETTIAEFYQDRGFHLSEMKPDAFPLAPATLADLRGADRATNAETVRRILRGEERGPRRDAVLLNAAAAFVVADQARSFAEGWERAAKLIDGGTALAKLVELRLSI